MTGGAEYLYFSVRLLSWLMKFGFKKARTATEK